MKKFYMLALPIVFGVISNSAIAQTTIDFEELVVPGADSAWLGSDNSGGFTSQNVFFENTYTVSQWGDYWSGFVYSNSTDVTTPGSSNGHSAYAGGGANGSNNYAVNYGAGLEFADVQILTSIDITNNTYAALSMLNGDAFAKQFGSPNNADGDPDGTNGEDWFRLLIIGKDQMGAVTDTVIVYLADYRFADNMQDYILDTWETVDLTPLGTIKYLDFALESSDVGQWGMNTPAYFALDNLTGADLATSEFNKNNYKVYPNPANNEINFVGLTGELNIFNNLGQVVATEELTGMNQVDISALANGTYTFKVANASGVFVKN